MEIKRILTRDGSDSLYVPALDETYHSKHGAIQESNHVFIANGFEFYREKNNPASVAILEFGFGTGLNTLLTFMAGRAIKISYHSLEKYPVADEIAFQLNYGTMLECPAVFKEIISCSWNDWQEVSEDHTLLKEKTDFVDFTPSRTYDLIYFDAFAPNKQPELWSVDMLKKCHMALKEEGVFVTYSAKGQLRRDLEALGFKVERLPGPPGKAEMLRATKA